MEFAHGEDEVITQTLLSCALAWAAAPATAYEQHTTGGGKTQPESLQPGASSQIMDAIKLLSVNHTEHLEWTI